MRRQLGMALVVAAALTGCPRETDTPARAAGQPCASYRDCVPDGGAACGELVDCVDAVCAGGASLVLPCP